MADRLTPATDKFPSSAAFAAINEALNASEADKKDAIKQGNGIYAFTLKNAAGETDSWHIDLKNEGKVNKGVAEKADGMLRHIYGTEWSELLTRRGSQSR